jgi:hypothetical protein
MALFMDIHTMDGPVSAEQVAGAHCADLETQGRYGVDYRQYWVDEEHGRIFCLVEAPDADAAISVHREAPNPPVVVLVSGREAATYGPRLNQTSARGFISKSELSGKALAALVGLSVRCSAGS